MPRRSSKRGSAARRKNFRSLASLLDAQPRGLVAIEQHRLLWDHFMGSAHLQRLRISPSCYRLLNNALVDPESLEDFYTTYRLSPDPFYPLFLAVKRQWFRQREKWREERERAIMARMREMPEYRRRALRILAEYERKHHPMRDIPLWENRLFPKTKKRAEELFHLSEDEWYTLWSTHLTLLSHRYRGIPPLVNDQDEPTYSARLLAALVLRCRRVDRKEVLRNFRSLCKVHHPDHGGSAGTFRRIKTARDVLLNTRTSLS